MIVTRKQHVDAGFLDRIERQLLPTDRALDFVADLEREQRMMSDENAQRFARRAREGLADELDLVLVDPPVLERQRARGVDPSTATPGSSINGQRVSSMKRR